MESCSNQEQKQPKFQNQKKVWREDKLQFSETQQSFLGGSVGDFEESPISRPLKQNFKQKRIKFEDQNENDNEFERESVSYGEEIFSQRSSQIRPEDIDLRMSTVNFFTSSQQRLVNSKGDNTDLNSKMRKFQKELSLAQGPETDLGRYDHHILETPYSHRDGKVNFENKFDQKQNINFLNNGDNNLEQSLSFAQSDLSQIQDDEKNRQVNQDNDQELDCSMKLPPNINLKQTSTDGYKETLLFQGANQLSYQKSLQSRVEKQGLRIMEEVERLQATEADLSHGQNRQQIKHQSTRVKNADKAHQNMKIDYENEESEEFKEEILPAREANLIELDEEESVILESGLASQQFNTLENTQLLNVPITAQPVKSPVQKTISNNQVSQLSLPSDPNTKSQSSSAFQRQLNISSRQSQYQRDLQNDSRDMDYVETQGGLKIANVNYIDLIKQKRGTADPQKLSKDINYLNTNNLLNKLGEDNKIEEVDEDHYEKDAINKTKEMFKAGLQNKFQQPSLKKSHTDHQLIQSSTNKLDEVTEYYTDSSSFQSDDEWCEDQLRKDAARIERAAGGDQQQYVEDTFSNEEEEKEQVTIPSRSRGFQPNLNLYNSQIRFQPNLDKSKLVAMMKNTPMGKSDSALYKPRRFSQASGQGNSSKKSKAAQQRNINNPVIENVEEEDENDQNNNTIANNNTVTAFNPNSSNSNIINRMPSRQQTQRSQLQQPANQQAPLNKQTTVKKQLQLQLQLQNSDSDEVFGIHIDSDEEGLVQADAEVLDEGIFNEDEKKQRKKFFEDFLDAKNMIVPSSLGELAGLSQPESDEQNNPNTLDIDYESDDSTASQRKEQGYVPKDLRTELQKKNFQGLKVLSPLSWYVHESIFYSIELMPGSEKKKYFGPEKELEYNILENEELFRVHKNPFAELKKISEYNIINQELDTDFEKDLNFKGNFHLALYHLPDFTLIKTINLPIFYLHRSSMLTVSSPSNFQIYTSRCVYFISLHGCFDTYKYSKDFNRDPNCQVSVEQAMDRRINIDLKRHYEKVSFQVVIYFSHQDQIIMAAQLGNKMKGDRQQQDRKVRRLILTQECWMDTFTLPETFTYVTTEDESTCINIQNCWIANERTLLLRSNLGLLYTLGRDQEKLIPLHLGKKQMQQYYKLRMDKINSDKMNKKDTQQDITIGEEKFEGDFVDKNADHITLDMKQSERMHVCNFTVCSLDLDNNVNNSYVSFKIHLDGSHDRISFGKVKDVQYLKVIENFRLNEFPGFKKAANQTGLTINFWSIKTREVFTFDLNEIKFIPYTFFQGRLYKIKNTLIFNTGQGSGSEHIVDKEFNKYMLIFYKKDKRTGYVVRSLALKKQVELIPDALTQYGTLSNKDMSSDIFHQTTNEFLSYLSVRSQFGSKQSANPKQASLIYRQRMQMNFQLQKAKNQKRMMFGLSKHSSIYQSRIQVNNQQNQGAVSRFFTRVFTINNNNLQNSMNASGGGQSPQQLARAKTKLMKKERKKHLMSLQETPVQQVFDSEVQLLNRLKYQMCKGRVQELFQQRVIYQHFNDKWNTVEDLSYHQVVKCSKDFIWRAFAEKNYIVFYRYKRSYFEKSFQRKSNDQNQSLKSQKTNQSLVLKQKPEANLSNENKSQKEDDDIQVQIIKFKRGCQIREAHLSSELSHLIIIYQIQDKISENHFRRSIILSLKDLSKPCCDHSIQNIKSIIHFGGGNLILLSKRLPKIKEQNQGQISIISQQSLPSQPTPTQKWWSKVLLKKPGVKSSDMNKQGSDRELTFLKYYSFEEKEANYQGANLLQNILQEDDTYILGNIECLELTDLLRQQNFQKKLDYFTHKPQSMFHLIYQGRYLLINCDFSYYMIVDLDGFNYLGSFELLDKHIYLKFDSNCLYLINIPSTDSRHKIQKQVIINDGFIETILRHSIQKLHIVVDLSREKIIIQDSEYQEVAHVSLNFEQKLPTAVLHAQNQFNEITNDHEMVKQIQEQMSVDQLVSHYDTYNASFLHQVFLRSPKVLETISKKLAQAQIGQINRSIPFLFVKDSQLSTVLDIAVESQEIVKINIILDMMMRFHNSIHLNELIDPHVNYMLKHKFNLREYFESELPMARIQNMNYPNYSKDSSTIIYGEFDDNNTLDFIWNNYSSYLGSKINEKSEDGQVQVEYFFMNLPHTISKREFMINLSSVTDLEVYESLPIKTIIDYKWDVYAEKAAFLQFLIYMVFLLCYSVDIYLLICQGQKLFDDNSDETDPNPNEGDSGNDTQGEDIADGSRMRMLQGYVDGRNDGARIVPKIFCLIYILLMEIYELKLIFSTGWRNYLKDAWNISDQLFALNYFVCIGVDWHRGPCDALTILQSIMCILVFIKACSNLRVFKGFSFQMSMLKAVFFDIRYFILLYTFVLTMYGFIFSLLGILPDEENLYYEGVSYFGYIIMAFKASVGDTQSDLFFMLSDDLILFAWLVWISAVLFLQVIMLNFIIAVIGESYDKVMQRMMAEAYRVKALLIKERESFFTEVDFQKNEMKDNQERPNFPRYLILRRPVLHDGNQDVDWQGFVRDLKKTINKAEQNQMDSMRTNNQQLRQIIFDKLETLKKEIQVRQEGLETQVKNQVADLKVQQDDNYQRLASLEIKIDLIMKNQNDQRKQRIYEERRYNQDIKPLFDLVRGIQSQASPFRRQSTLMSPPQPYTLELSNQVRSAQMPQIRNDLIPNQQLLSPEQITQFDLQGGSINNNSRLLDEQHARNRKQTHQYPDYPLEELQVAEQIVLNQFRSQVQVEQDQRRLSLQQARSSSNFRQVQVNDQDQFPQAPGYSILHHVATLNTFPSELRESVSSSTYGLQPGQSTLGGLGRQGSQLPYLGQYGSRISQNGVGPNTSMNNGVQEIYAGMDRGIPEEEESNEEDECCATE